MNALIDEILRNYPTSMHGVVIPLGNHGGFSGARLWRIDLAHESLCLKAWPSHGRSSEELRWIHRLMGKAVDFAWMPRLIPTITGASLVRYHGRLWELTTWMPGQADATLSLSIERLESACVALAELHQCWGTAASKFGVCPAVKRRLQSWRTWTDLLESGWCPELAAADPYAAYSSLLFREVQPCGHELRQRLLPWIDVIVPIQPCVCDVWREHILYTGNAVTGLIDFGGVKVDHVSVDIARLLGSLIGDDIAKLRIGLRSYRKIRPFSDDERRLALDLDRTGVIVAATNWLRWLYHDRRTFEQPTAVVKRLEHLAARLTSNAQLPANLHCLQQE